MQVIIDRFEGIYAICEQADRNMIKILKSKLPAGAKEGDVLIIEGENLRIDSAETSKRRKIAEDMMHDIWKG
jgi:hypothetical protein